jgi:hypothetical protein
MVIPGAPSEDAGEQPAIREVKARHEGRLLSLPGVVSVGIGLGADGSPVIVVGLDRTRGSTLQEIPEELEGYPVQVEMVGTVRAL